jgi:glycerol-3-phosphate dehydrogenase
MVGSPEFSFRTREESLKKFRSETFDLLIIGGGITGATVARDATSRGLKVALVERNDFAYGTSSRSSKLIHGGLRYLQNFEFGLVFEALAERALLLKTVPHMVRPLPFYLPVYKGDANGKALLSLGLWLYDLLSLFRTPKFHRELSRDQFLKEMPFLEPNGLKGGFQYFDASMWDDVLAVENLKAAQTGGASVASYVEALEPLWEKERIVGFRVRDREHKPDQKQGAPFEVRALNVIVCAGPWTDQVGLTLSKDWPRWLNLSKGVHLVFDSKRIPVPGAMVMSHPTDGRIAFVIPRPDYGAGVVIVGTTDGATDRDPDQARVSDLDVDYLMGLLNRYFPSLNLTTEDILSTYVGVRPLMAGQTLNELESKGQAESVGAKKSGTKTSTVLQKVSREHHIANGPGGTVVIAGGKYTTARKVAEEIVDFTLKSWRKSAAKNEVAPLPIPLGKSNTRIAVSPNATQEAVKNARTQIQEQKLNVPEELLSRYGADALTILEIQSEKGKNSTSTVEDPKGFPLLKAQLRFAIRNEMVMHLEDFYFRRVSLFLSRKDHGLPWAEALAQVWAEERGLALSAVQIELELLKSEISKRSQFISSSFDHKA